MKLRLLEYIICPNHPDEFLQLREGHIAKLFDYACKVRSPLCRNYCGLAQGRFEKIPPEIVMDCQDCMSLDVEWGILQCPVCGGFYVLYEGIPVLTHFFPANTDLAADMLATEYHFGKSKLTEYKRNGPFAGWADHSEARTLAERIDLESIDSVLFLGSASSDVIDLFGERGIEIVIACEDPDELICINEKELLNPSRLTFTSVSGSSPNPFRRNAFDLVITGYRLYGTTDFGPPPLCDLIRVCKKSGVIALMLYRRNFAKRVLHLCEGRYGRMKKPVLKTKEFIDRLLEGQTQIGMEHYPTMLFDLVVLRSKVLPSDDTRMAFPGDSAEAMINA